MEAEAATATARMEYHRSFCKDSSIVSCHDLSRLCLLLLTHIEASFNIAKTTTMTTYN